MKLEPLKWDDLETLRTWRNDPRVMKWAARQSSPITPEQQHAWYERIIKCDDTDVMVAWEDDRRVAVVTLSDIDNRHKRAEFGIYVDPNRQGQGIGKRALPLLLKVAFTGYGLETVWGETLDGNHAGKLFEACGMAHTGLRRSFYLKDGKHTDAHIYSVLRSEWHERQA